MASILVSFIIQYYKNPGQLVAIVSRLQHPLVEVLIHADSQCESDRVVFNRATALYGNVRVIESGNVHEVRGYNKVALSHARGALVAFSQDDRLPPISTAWVDAAGGIFDAAGPKFALLGMHRGRDLTLDKRSGKRSPKLGLLGSCGDAHGLRPDVFERLPSVDMTEPLGYATLVNIGPVLVRTSVFAELGGFNESYSPPGEPGIGFDFEFSARLWAAGYQGAVLCPSRLTAFRNGCGGKMTTATAKRKKARERRSKINLALFRSQIPPSLGARLDGLVRDAQQSLRFQNPAFLAKITALVPGCLKCSTASPKELFYDLADNETCHAVRRE